MKNAPTKQAIKLAEALRKRGIEVETEHWDGYKHVDLFIPKAKLYIEIDGIQHYTDPKQIITDLKREHYSDKENFKTFSVSNQIVEKFLDEVANAIAQIIN